jgi:hypothetical protein
MEVRVDLARIIIHDNSDQQYIVLKERDGERSFPIVIGDNEANAIDRRIKNVKLPRPMTHDLLSSVIDKMDGEIEKIVIHDLKDHTFYAKLVIRQNGRMVEIDSRPSDAIALAAGGEPEIPFFVEESVLREVCG